MGRRRITDRDLTGHRFGRLVAVRYAGRSECRIRLWECVCDCGGKKTSSENDLLRRAVTSCGCFAHRGRLRHGGAVGTRRTGEYGCWQAMKNRCCNSSATDYARYGAKGITVCKRWIDSFEAFREDMGPRPEGYSIDRIDGTRGYEPSNCRWATTAQQNVNKCNTIKIAYAGKTQSVKEWATELGLRPTTLYRRMELWNGDGARAITTAVRRLRNPSRGVAKRYGFEGRTVTAKELASVFQLPYSTVISRLARRGGDARRAIGIPAQGGCGACQCANPLLQKVEGK